MQSNHRHSRPLRRHGFSLVEMLVVVAIIAMLVGLLLPALQRTREAARRTSCGNNLRQLAVACETHRSSLGHLPTGGWDLTWLGDPALGSDWKQPGGWCFVLLPYLGQTNLHTLAGTNVDEFVTRNVPTFVCPTRRATGVVPIAAGVTRPKNTVATVGADVGSWMHTDYAGNRGAWASSPASPTNSDTDRDTTFGMVGATVPTTYPTNLNSFQTDVGTVASSLNASQAPPGSGGAVQTAGVIFAGSSVSPTAIRDGQAKTYLCAEKYVPREQWMTGDNPADDQCAWVGDSPDTLRGGHTVPRGDDTPWQASFQGAFGGPHPGIFMAARCDGAVSALSLDIDARVHFLLAAKADGQKVSLPE